jgi:hypothetical protein
MREAPAGRFRSIDIAAWDLAEGDVLPGERRVIEVRRDAKARTVTVVTDEPTRAVLAASDLVPVVRLAPTR